MNRRTIKAIIKATLVMMCLSIGSAFAPTTSAEASTSIEKEFISVVSKYDKDEVVVEDGISLRKGETLDLSKYPGWKMSNENVLTIDQSGVVKPKNSGTVYLSNKIGDKVHIVEIYVPKNAARNSGATRSKVDRNYYKVFIDPGHGGSDNGADGNGLYEDVLTLQIANRVKDKLVAKGIEVKMSRTSDVFVSLGERAEMANAYGADAFVSPHINSFTSSGAYGIETYYHRDKGAHKPLSDNIQGNAIKETGAHNRGVKNANFAVLRESNMPSSLFEAGFISNPTEAAKLKSADYQDKLAKAMADGIEKYLKDNVQLTGTPTTPPKPDPEKPTPPPVATKTGTVTASSLNVRSGATTGSSIIGSLKKGAKVEIISTHGSWHKIKYGSGQGYVSADYVTVATTPTPTPPPTPEPEKPTPPPVATKTGTVTASSLNVRSGATTGSSIIGSLKKGAKVEIISTHGSWHKIKYGSGQGYVSADYVTVATTPTPTPPPTKPDPEKPTPPPVASKTGTVTASSLNVRSGATTGSSIIGSLKKGAKVEIISTHGSWHKIKYGSGQGYVSADYVKVATTPTPTPPPTNPEPEKPTPPPTVGTKTGTVTASSLNVRSGATTGSSIIGSLRNGAKVEIISTHGSWHKIKYGSGHGYISADYVRVNSSNTGGGATTPSQVRTGTVTASSLNVRERATTNSLIIGAFRKGAKVKVLGTSGGWHKIEYGYGSGYVSSDYVRF